MSRPSGTDALTPFQLAVAQTFFAQPASASFLLAGGAALLANGAGSRPTEDLDLFTRSGGDTVLDVLEEFVTACTSRGWQIDVVRESETFCRLLVRGDDEVLVDLALDSPPIRPPEITRAGPTFALTELAGRKVVALFDRAAARDFVDVLTLASRYSRDELLSFASETDLGFDPLIFATMLDSVERFSDEDLRLGDADPDAVRAFARDWAEALRTAGQANAPDPETD